MGFLMTKLAEILNTAPLGHSWWVGKLILTPPILHRSSMEMVDRGGLDEVPDDQSWWNLKHSTFWTFLMGWPTHLDSTYPSQIQPGYGGSWWGSWWPILVRFETQHLWDIPDVLANSSSIMPPPVPDRSNLEMVDKGNLDEVPDDISRRI